MLRFIAMGSFFLTSFQSIAASDLGSGFLHGIGAQIAGYEKNGTGVLDEVQAGYAAAGGKGDVINAVSQTVGKSIGRVSVGITKGVVEGLADSDFGEEVGGVLGKEVGKGATAFVRAHADRVNSDEYKREVERNAQGMGRSWKRISVATARGLSAAIAPILGPLIGYSVLGLGSAASIFVGAHYARKYIDEKMFVPELVTEKSESGIFYSIKKLLGFGGYKGPSYNDLVLAKHTKKELSRYFDVLKLASSKNIEMPSLLLFGPPGTGKTQVAMRMAKELNYNFAFLSGSSFSQYEESRAIAEMTGLFNWANKNKGRSLIFIDEADVLLMNRTSANFAEKSQKLLSHFLSFTGSLSEKFAIIYATNRPDVLDDAINRRIMDQIEMGLPGHPELVEIAKLYYKNSIELNKAIRVTHPPKDEDFERIASQMDGLAGAYMEEVWMRARNLSFLNSGILTPEIMFESVEQVVKKAEKKGSYIQQAR